MPNVFISRAATPEPTLSEMLDAVRGMVSDSDRITRKLLDQIKEVNATFIVDELDKAQKADSHPGVVVNGMLEGYAMLLATVMSVVKLADGADPEHACREVGKCFTERLVANYMKLYREGMTQ